MTGHRPFSDLTRDWSPARRKRVKDGTDQLLQEMRLRAKSPSPTSQMSAMCLPHTPELPGRVWSHQACTRLRSVSAELSSA